MPSLVVQSSQTSAMGALNVRSMLTLRRAGCVCEVKLRTAPIGPLEGRDVELAHFQQGFHDFRRVPGLRVSHHLPQSRGDDLPRHTESILEPAAWSFLSTLGEPRPDLIKLLLSFARAD